MNFGDVIKLNFGDSIKTNFIEMTIDSAETAQSLTFYESSGSTSNSWEYWGDVTNETYLYLLGTIKNISGNPLNVTEYTYVHFIFDDTYNYYGDLDMLSADHDMYYSINPLVTCDAYIVTTVPDELINSYTTCRVQIGFNKNFETRPEDVADFSQYDYRYQIDLSR